jgi:iron complex outermembrane receptor protein
MTAVRCSFLLFLFTMSLSAASLRGTVKTAAGLPLAGATVSLETAERVTDERGDFAFDVADGAYTLRVAHDGFRDDVRRVRAGEEVNVVLAAALQESIVVSGIRAEAKTPVTKSELTRHEIERDYYGQDVPLLLRETPSINAYAEAGVGGSGYSYITLRGISPTRINFTLDGVPLADSEDMGTYFADFPDLAHSLQSIQVQRGVGTSTVGSPSFGGSVNMESIALAQNERFDAELGGGSYGAKSATAGYQTGALPGGFTLYSRLSFNQSDGFRESSGVRQHNLFISAAKQSDTSQLRLTGFTGHEYSALAFFAADADTLQTNLRSNPLSADDRDSFGYDLAQLQYLRALSPHSDMTLSTYYQRGYGWYRLYDDEASREGLRQYGLDGVLVGAMATMSWTRGAITANYGVHVNEFRREHTRDLVDGPRDYYNYGTKGEANVFAKVSRDSTRWHLYADAQLRRSDFHYHGDVAHAVDIGPISWTFFNPKLGARYALSASSSLYASAGISTREPTRNDLFLGEDNATVPHDLHAVRPERLIDVEAGWNWNGTTATLAANLYSMQFHNEIASTGEYSDIGLLLRRNVDRSDRRGIELEGTWRATPQVTLRGNANASRNRISQWTQFFDVYDSSGAFIGSEPRVYRDVNPVATPSLLANVAIDYAPTSRIRLGAEGRYVSKAYLDNTNSEAFITPSFTTVDGVVAVDVAPSIRVTLRVNNLLDAKRIYPSGYSYQWLENGSLYGTSYYFPQATRNATVMLDFRP